MNNPFAVLIGLVSVVLAVVAAFAAYRWKQRTRARRVEEWVKGYLVTRYGRLPDRLNIICTDDALWPVLVAFERPGARHSLQFSCAKDESSFFLLREKEEPYAGAPSDPAPLPLPAVRQEAIPEVSIAQ